MKESLRDNRRNDLTASFILILVVTIVAFSGCAQQNILENTHVATSESIPGAVLGVAHGLVWPLTLVLSWIGACSVYAVPNSGLHYDLGFALGLSLPFLLVGTYLGMRQNRTD